MGFATWEGVAAELLAETGLESAPQCAFELAACCGLKIRAWSRVGAGLHGRTVWYPRNARTVRQHGLIAHELGHFALDRYGEAQSEDAARYLAGALMLPRRVLGADLDRCGWDIERLRARHPNASVEMLARRIAQLEAATVSIYDGGRLTRRAVSPWAGLDDGPQQRERDLAQLVFRFGKPCDDGGARAVPVFDGPHRRVVVLSRLR